MKFEGQTKEVLLKAAKKQFMENGYMGASLRNICKEADVTTGALYFFFKDKEDLFGALVEKPLKLIYEIMKEHYENEMSDIKKTILKRSNSKANEDITSIAVDCLYQHHDEFVLLLMKSQGSRYENCADEFVKITEKHYRILADRTSELYEVGRIDDYIIHWFAHLQIFSFVQLITHGLSKDEALVQMKTIVKFFINGWFGMYK